MTKKNKSAKTIKVDYLARVEGEGALYLKIKDKKVTDAKLKIFEPPRFFEAFMRGRSCFEAPDITARICGICPIAYQSSSVHAMEDAFGISVGGQLRELRRLIYCGEWIESHVLHIYMLHAPDFLGYQDAIQMAKDYPDLVKNGLWLKKIGNEIVNIIGGREIHPINMRVGGFYKVPKKKNLLPLAEDLKKARDIAVATVKWAATLDYPGFEQDYEYVSLSHPNEYPFNEGRLVSNKGLDIDIRDYNNHFEEIHVEHSNALQCVLKERGAYFTGPLARYNLCRDKLSPLAKETAKEAGVENGTNNPFKSILVRAIEVVYACDEALRIIDQYEKPDSPHEFVQTKAGIGHGCTEAPRGILYHQYKVDEKGIIQKAQIVPPTAQNQKRIEQDLKYYAEKFVDLPDEKLTWQCEQAIRNYDPCISCATHFLKLHVDRE